MPIASKRRVISLPIPPAAPVMMASLWVFGHSWSTPVARADPASDLKEGRSRAVVMLSAAETSPHENDHKALGEGFLVLVTCRPA